MLYHTRRAFAVILLIFAFLSQFAVPVSASPREDAIALSRSFIIYSDGSYDETVYYFSVSVDRSIRNGSVSKTHYTDGNEVAWKVTLTGTYTYNGVTSSCINAVTNVTFYKPNWVVVSENTSYSGNTATTNVVLGYNVLGTVVPLANVNLSLSCDKDGNLS